MCYGSIAGTFGTSDRNGYSGVFPYFARCWKGDGRLGRFEASVFTDLLEPAGEDAHSKAVYASDYYAGTCALVCNSYGKGQAWYYGSAFSEEAAEVFLRKLGVASPYKDLVEAPKECEIAVRCKKGQKYLFLLNYGKEPVQITFHREGTDLYTGEKTVGSKKLDGYGTMVVKIS